VRALAVLAVLIVALCTSMPAAGYEPRINYQLQCMGCHHADGGGEGTRVPSMRQTLVLFSSTAEGREFVMRVPGVAQAPLSDTELATLLNWMARNLSDVPLPGNFVDYTSAEVSAMRHRPLVHVREARSRLLSHLAE
jgi:hypothetical protein